MKRFFSDDKFTRLYNDFPFLIRKIKKYKGELDIRLRDDYFNLYYKGNSLAKIISRKNNYEILIHKKFAERVFGTDKRFKQNGSIKSEYCSICCGADLLPALFQNKYLNKMCSNIKKVNYSEEITFEQMLITDNLSREDFIIIDRQVTETGMDGKLDLLVLRQNKANQFYFEIIEVKLGNNKELAFDVGRQIERYISHIKTNINGWINCYEAVFKQMRRLKLFDYLPWEEIKIGPEVSGLIVVGGYSGIAKASLQSLKNHYPELRVKPLENKL